MLMLRSNVDSSMTTKQPSIACFRKVKHRLLLMAYIAVAMSVSLSPLQVAAQLDADMAAALLDCTGISRDRARLACFDRVFAGSDLTTRDVADADTDAGGAPQSRVLTEPDRNDAPPSSPDAPAAELVSIVEVQTNRAGRATFVTADGTVWVQTDSYRRRYPAVPFDAEIDAASMGSFFLKVPGGARAVRVARRD